MAILPASHLATGFGILGNIVSFLVYMAPVPTFYRIWKKKSTEGFQSIPYSVALFSAMLYLYYAFLKDKALILITINTVGFIMEVAYLTIYLIYATKKSRVFTTRLLLLFNVSLLGFIIAGTYYLAQGHTRLHIVGWICAAFSLSVFAAPLSIMRQVIRTKSVEFMPFSLSLFLTLCAVVWFFYGFLIHDYYIATPNIMGFLFGIAQMILYVIYSRNNGARQQMINEKDEHQMINDINVPAAASSELAKKQLVHDHIIVEINELKALDHSQDQMIINYSSDKNQSSKHDLEIVVQDFDDEQLRTCRN